MADIRLGLETVGDLTLLSGFGRPFGLKVLDTGGMLVTDMDLHTVFEIDAAWSRVRAMDDGPRWSDWQAIERGHVPRAASRPPGYFNGPHSVDVARDGSLCVTTYYDPALHVVDPEARRSATVRSLSSDAILKGPATGVYANDGDLLVTEYVLNCVFVLDPDLTLKRVLPTPHNGAPRAMRLDRPHMAMRAPDGIYVIADTWHHRLLQVDAEGQPLGWIGADLAGSVGTGWRSPVEAGAPSALKGGLHAPVAIDLDRETGEMLVTDWGNNRLQLFSRHGVVLASIETLGLDKPYDAKFFWDGLLVADSHHGRVIATRRRR
jgi:hypothetical protein